MLSKAHQLATTCQFLTLLCIGRKLDAEVVYRNSTSLAQTLNHLDNALKTYDKRVRPYSDERPVIVTCQVDFAKVHPLQYEGKLTLDIYIRNAWNDPRLHHNATKFITYVGQQEMFWHPDIFFENGMKSSKHDLLKPNEYFRIWPNGDVLSSTRVTVEVSCPQDLTKYPFDVQKCQLSLESYSYTTEEMILKWMNNSSIMLLDNEMVQFVVTKATMHTQDKVYITGTFTNAHIKIYLKRRIGHYVFHVFIPCNFIVMLSFLTFWMDADNIGDRLAVGITTVLTIVLLMESINNHLPKVSYIKAIDGYLIGSFLLVFATVAETVFAFYNVNGSEGSTPKMLRLFRKASLDLQTRDVHRLNGSTIVENVPAANGVEEEISNGVAGNGQQTSVVNDRAAGSRIDSYSKILFPFIFIFSNIVYWSIMLSNRY